MAVTATFTPANGLLSEFGDALDNVITTSRNAAGPFWSTAAQWRFRAAPPPSAIPP
jgi:hypothetical protein